MEKEQVIHKMNYFDELSKERRSRRTYTPEIATSLYTAILDPRRPRKASRMDDAPYR
ncbi:MAG: hypothetical protein HYU64_17185 [Armatimonadetes bacterium]|nr:hypothetical protein [Armatimonadota bacterium]